jgi:hypothetical protein
MRSEERDELNRNITGREDCRVRERGVKSGGVAITRVLGL